MALQVFRYKSMRGILTPLITIGVRLGESWYPIEAYVDSGAAYTVLHAQVGQGADFDYRLGELMQLRVGDGDSIPTYVHALELQIGAERFTGKVGFSERLGVGFNLLGRENIFDRFKICFLEREKIISFEN